jgi:ribulose 1,5-bisphosphate synthetase/thiazole synthase
MKNIKVITLTIIIARFLIVSPANAQTSQAINADVCIYGGTSAGVIAAYTAKKMGKTVILIEPGKHLDGMSSGGLGYTDISQENKAYVEISNKNADGVIVADAVLFVPVR